MCSQYSSGEIIDYIVPTQIISDTLCQSTDKTNMFLVGVLRIIIFLSIHKYVFSHNNTLISDIIWLKIMSVIYILINIYVLFYIISKKQKYPKQNMESTKVLGSSHNLHD